MLINTIGKDGKEMDADKVKCVIESDSFSNRRYEVLCDLSDAQLKKIKGVEDAIELRPHHFSVYIDPRYVTWQVLENIKKCAEE
jgi:YbbR domain-containing protein